MAVSRFFVAKCGCKPCPLVESGADFQMPFCSGPSPAPPHVLARTLFAAPPAPGCTSAQAPESAAGAQAMVETARWAVDPPREPA